MTSATMTTISPAMPARRSRQRPPATETELVPSEDVYRRAGGAVGQFGDSPIGDSAPASVRYRVLRSYHRDAGRLRYHVVVEHPGTARETEVRRFATAGEARLCVGELRRAMVAGGWRRDV